MTAPTERPGPRWVFCDLDGTLLRGDTLMLFLIDSVRRGWLSPIRLARVAAAVMMNRAGMIDRDRLRQITWDLIFRDREIPREAIERFIGRLIADERRWHPEVVRILREEAERGATLVMITNSFDFLADPIARHFGFHAVHAVPAPTEGNRFVSGSMEALVGERKARIVRELACGGDAVATGLGNTSDDVDFLRLCGTAYFVTRRGSLRVNEL